MKVLSTRDRLVQAGRYSRFVALMRYALPTAAVVIGIILLIWPNPNGDEHNLPATTMGVREMVNPHYRGVNTKGDPVDVTAVRAVQAGDMKDMINLETIHASLVRSAGGKVTLDAQKGQYDQKKNHIHLESQVHIVDDKGYDIVTDTAEIDLNTPSQAWGNAPVTGHGPQGNIAANGFRVTDEGKTIVFTGRTHLEMKNGVPK